MSVRIPLLDTLMKELGEDGEDGWSSSENENEDEEDDVSSLEGSLPAIGLGLGSLSDLELDDMDDQDRKAGKDLIDLMLNSLLLEADFPFSSTLIRTSRSVKRKGLASPSVIRPSAFPLPPTPRLSFASSTPRSASTSRSPSFVNSPFSDASWGSDDLALRTPEVDPSCTWDVSLKTWMLSPPPSGSSPSPSSFPSPPSFLLGFDESIRIRPVAPSTPALNRPPGIPLPTCSPYPTTSKPHPFAASRKSSWNRPSSRPSPPPSLPPLILSPPTPPRPKFTFSASSRESSPAHVARSDTSSPSYISSRPSTASSSSSFYPRRRDVLSQNAVRCPPR